MIHEFKLDFILGKPSRYSGNVYETTSFRDAMDKALNREHGLPLSLGAGDSKNSFKLPIAKLEDMVGMVKGYNISHGSVTILAEIFDYAIKMVNDFDDPSYRFAGMVDVFKEHDNLTIIHAISFIYVAKRN